MRKVVEVTEVVQETPSTVTLRFPYPMAAEPGQFVMIWLPGDDELPMSLSYTDGPSKGVTIKEMGETTRRSLNLRRGARIGIRGPYGNRFDLSPRRILVVGGGSGTAVLAPAAERALAHGGRVTVALGATQRIAAANGQFLLVEREAYRRLGGHRAWPTRCWRTWSWPFCAKRRKVGLRFRYADDAVSARMYRSTAAMIEGWTKNLKLLFNNALILAVWRAIDIFLLFGLPVLAYELWNARLGAHGPEWCSGAGWILALLWLRTLFRFYARGEVELSVSRLRDFAAGFAAVCGAALSQLVSAPDSEARKLEGAGIQGLGNRELGLGTRDRVCSN